MSTAKKILLGLSILLIIAGIVYSVLLHQKATGFASHLTEVERVLKNPDKLITITYHGNFRADKSSEPEATVKLYSLQLKTTIEKLNDTITELDNTKKELSDTKTEVNNLKVELAGTKEDLAKTKTDLDAKTSQLAELQKTYDTLKDSLKGETAADLFARIDKQKGEIDTLTDEKKKLEETCADQSKKIANYIELDNLRDQKKALPTLSGRVVAVNRPWSFVVLDVGKKEKLVENVELTVYRGDQYIGKIRTVSVDDNTAVADILPGWQQGDILVGDQVLF
jgi:DNA repair exonuclease SbcCD ATPase subunit